MAETNEVIFERNVEGEEALIIRDGLNNLQHPKVLEILQKMDNFPPDLFERLLRLDFKPDSEKENIFEEDGIKTEDLLLRTVNIPPYGEIEVSDVIRHPTQVSKEVSLDLDLHLKQANIRGFEVIYVLDGEATLSFPEEVIPAGIGVYSRSEPKADVRLQKGDLALIPAPTANGWTHVKEGFRFRYIGLPPWNKDLVAKTF